MEKLNQSGFTEVEELCCPGDETLIRSLLTDGEWAEFDRLGQRLDLHALLDRNSSDKKIVELYDGDQIDLMSFCDEFNLNPDRVDLRMLKLTCSIDAGYYPGETETTVEIQYNNEV